VWGIFLLVRGWGEISSGRIAERFCGKHHCRSVLFLYKMPKPSGYTQRGYEVR